MIYKITNLANGHIYIGQSRHGGAWRWRHHVSAAKLQRNEHLPLYRAIKKYGPNGFAVDEIEVCDDISELDAAEQFWIRYFNCMLPTGYNLTYGGAMYTKEHIKKASIARTGKKRGPMSQATKDKIAAAHRGLKCTLAHRAKLREAMVGRFTGAQNHFHGKKHSIESLLRMSIKPAHIHTKERREELSRRNSGSGNPFFGRKQKPLTNDQRQRLSDAVRASWVWRRIKNVPSAAI